MTANAEYVGRYERRGSTFRLRQWLADIPVLSLVLLRLCESDDGRSLVHAEWRWRKCLSRNGSLGMDKS